VQLLCHQLLTRLNTLDTQCIKACAKNAVPALRKSIFRRTKDTATKQEIEDSQELIKSSLNLVLLIDDLMPSEPDWAALIAEIKKAREEQQTIVGVKLSEYFPK
jgi:hypothetical protein